MFMAYFILIVSTALALFYIQTACEKILRRRLEETCCADIIRAYRLEYAGLRETLNQGKVGPDWASLSSGLQGDFNSLTYLLRNACNTRRRFSKDEHLLIAYFRAVFLCLRLCHVFRFNEKACVLKLAAILQYFCDILAVRMSTVRSGRLDAAHFLMRA